MNDSPTPDVPEPAEAEAPAPVEKTEAEKPKERQPQSFARRALTFVLVLFVGLFATMWALVYFLQDAALFPAPGPNAVTDQYRDPRTQELTFETDQGHQAVAWFIPGRGVSAEHPGPAMMVFHGNGELIDTQYTNRGLQNYTELGVSVLIPEYRGYGRAQGKPSQVGIGKDMIQFYDQLAARPEVDPQRIAFHGISLGGAVAAELTRSRTPRALILQSTFTSVHVMAKDFLVPSFFIKNPFDTRDVLATFEQPTLIFHGTEDRVIPFTHGQELADLQSHFVFKSYSCGHNDLPGATNSRDYWLTIGRFLVESGVIVLPDAQAPLPKMTPSPTELPERSQRRPGNL